MLTWVFLLNNNNIYQKQVNPHTMRPLALKDHFFPTVMTIVTERFKARFADNEIEN